MASNLSSIGFAFADEQAYRTTIERLAGEARERVPCPDGGEYAIWRSRTGAEVWLHLARPNSEGEREIVGLTPFFEGRSDIPLAIAEFHCRPDDNVFEGAWTAGVVEDGGDEDGLYPIVLDALDAAVHVDRDDVLDVRTRIVGFARAIERVAEADQAHGLIPTGLLEASEKAEGNAAHDEAAPLHAASTAVIAGRIVDHQRLVNELSGEAFHWLSLATHGATFDIVADPELVRDGIAAGEEVEIECYLVGRIIE